MAIDEPALWARQGGRSSVDDARAPYEPLVPYDRVHGHEHGRGRDCVHGGVNGCCEDVRHW